MRTHVLTARAALLLIALGLPLTASAAKAPCSLLTPAEISGTLGGAFGAGQPIGTTGCSWTNDKPHMIVTVSLWPPTEWDRIKSGAGPVGGKITPTSGLGEDAFYASIAGYTVLYVKKAGTVYLFKVYGVKDESKQANAEKTLALDALQKM